MLRSFNLFNFVFMQPTARLKLIGSELYVIFRHIGSIGQSICSLAGIETHAVIAKHVGIDPRVHHSIVEPKSPLVKEHKIELLIASLRKAIAEFSRTISMFQLWISFSSSLGVRRFLRNFGSCIFRFLNTNLIQDPALTIR